MEKPGGLQFTGSQRVGHDVAAEQQQRSFGKSTNVAEGSAGAELLGDRAAWPLGEQTLCIGNGWEGTGRHVE